MSSKAEFNFVKIAKFEELPCHETAQHVILRPITSSEETNLTFHYWDRTAGGDQGEKDFLLILHFIKLGMKFALKVVIIYLCSVDPSSNQNKFLSRNHHWPSGPLAHP